MSVLLGILPSCRALGLELCFRLLTGLAWPLARPCSPAA